jgi:hypothetical protein
MVLKNVKIETSKKIPLKNKNAKNINFYTREYLGIFENQSNILINTFPFIFNYTILCIVLREIQST